ncbi:hypothetical protein [Diaphorobacter aerolatus]|uniref:DUF2383 domain-containing protein n=1 Tax=Diaphorobacter aerolatus TaxID=1288495 RepID=A0A7H0GP87_9BURK|nr:hypothetical protein [Diaphorobacter aerolatus]QNP50103.1 hypothetical protein H9K75_09870 [Diaphorobacter aerolatus]
MFPEKIAKSHLVKLHRMLEDIARASKDLEALRVAYQRIADQCEHEPHGVAGTAVASAVLGQPQASRCAEIVVAHSALKLDIDAALMRGTDGKRVCALLERLDALEDERDALDAELRSTEQSLVMRRPFVVEDPP